VTFLEGIILLPRLKGLIQENMMRVVQMAQFNSQSFSSIFVKTIVLDTGHTCTFTECQAISSLLFRERV